MSKRVRDSASPTSPTTVHNDTTLNSTTASPASSPAKKTKSSKVDGSQKALLMAKIFEVAKEYGYAKLGDSCGMTAEQVTNQLRENRANMKKVVMEAVKGP